MMEKEQQTMNKDLDNDVVYAETQPTEITDVNFNDEAGVAHSDTNPKGVHPTNQDDWWYWSDDDYDGEAKHAFINKAVENQMRRDLGDAYVDEHIRRHYARRAKYALARAVEDFLRAASELKEGDDPLFSQYDYDLANDINLLNRLAEIARKAWSSLGMALSPW